MATGSSFTHIERVDFSRIRTSVPIPNLIELQKSSYERFLQMDLLPDERDDIGLQSVFRSVFPSWNSSITRSATGSASAAP